MKWNSVQTKQPSSSDTMKRIPNNWVIYRQIIISILGLVFLYKLFSSIVFVKTFIHLFFGPTINHCPLISPKLVGWTNLSSSATESILREDQNVVEFRIKQAGVKSGGRYEPSECRSRNKVALIVPIRDRKEHLQVFLRYMHPFLQRQQLTYVIIVVEQSDGLAFNRGMLMNIGFKETGKLHGSYDCFIFHDVDLLPENDGNPYTCPEDGKPRQMSYIIDHSDYSKGSYIPTPLAHFGGVTTLSLKDFKRINGYSNSFWGWGGEDDQLYNRVLAQNLTVTRAFDGKPTSVVHYKSLSHKKAKKNPYRTKLIEEGSSLFKIDGLSSLKYEKLNFELRPLYTYILVSIKPNIM